MNTEKIGQAAGAVWKKLHGKGTTGLSLLELKKVPGFTAEETMAGLGWLAREGKLSFQTQGKKLTVSLVEDEIFAMA
jgi:hypothetical protein